MWKFIGGHALIRIRFLLVKSKQHPPKWIKTEISFFLTQTKAPGINKFKIIVSIIIRYKAPCIILLLHLWLLSPSSHHLRIRLMPWLFVHNIAMHGEEIEKKKKEHSNLFKQSYFEILYSFFMYVPWPLSLEYGHFIWKRI